MPKNTVPAAGEAMATTDPISVMIRNYREGDAAFNTRSTGESDEDDLVAATYGPALQVIERFTGNAATLDGALEALRFAVTEMEAFQHSDPVKPMVKAALGYFVGLQAESFWDRARRLSKELSQAMAQCDGGRWFSHVLPPTLSASDGGFGSLPMGTAAQDLPIDRINQLSWALSDALSHYRGGSVQAMVLPSSVAGHTVMFTTVQAFDGRKA